MLLVEKAKGQIWLGEQCLCDVEYEVSKTMKYTGNHEVQRIILILEDEHCTTLLDAYELTLVLTDGRRCKIPRPLQHVGLGDLECYVESLPSIL